MPPRFRELKSYCDKNGWVLIGNTDHWYYEKVLPNGDILKTKISHAVHKEIPPNIWMNILKHQLKTTEKEFNDNK
jgi:hypothetical protein